METGEEWEGLGLVVTGATLKCFQCPRVDGSGKKEVGAGKIADSGEVRKASK